MQVKPAALWRHGVLGQFGSVHNESKDYPPAVGERALWPRDLHGSMWVMEETRTGKGQRSPCRPHTRTLRQPRMQCAVHLSSEDSTG